MGFSRIGMYAGRGYRSRTELLKAMPEVKQTVQLNAFFSRMKSAKEVPTHQTPDK